MSLPFSLKVTQHRKEARFVSSLILSYTAKDTAMSSDEGGAAAMYAAVDMSKKKKKKNRSASEEKLEQTEYLNVSDLPEYSVVNKPKKPKPVAPYVPPASKTTAIELVEKSDQSELPTKSKSTTSKDDSVSADHKPAKSKSSYFLVLVIVLAVFFALAFLICLIISVVALSTTSRLRSDIESFRNDIESLQIQLNNDTAENKAQSLNEEEVEQLLSRLSLGRFEQTPVTSCAELHSISPSAYYWVRASNDSVVRVYCDMDLQCGNITGGWMRVAELNMTDTSQQCPSGLEERTVTNDIRSCEHGGTGCSPITYYTQNSYTKVCGRITAYQVGATNAFGRSSVPNSITIDSNYVDGVSLTHGISLKQHIWTFAAALDRTGNHTSRSSYCPCQNITQHDPVPPFVGEDYFCDAGNEEFMTGEDGLQTDPLWDGTDCLCCDNPPWFYKQLPRPTTDDIEMRVCRDEEASNEGIAVQLVEIYVQ